MIQGSLNKMQGVTALKGLYSLDPKSNIVIDIFLQAYNFIVAIGAIPLRLLLRKNLGERAISPFAFVVFLIAYLTHGYLIGIVIQAAFETGNNTIFDGLDPANPLFIILIIIIVKGITHFGRVILNASSNNIGYSYYRGESVFFQKNYKHQDKWLFGLPKNDEYIRMIKEPVISLLVGTFLFLGFFFVLKYQSWDFDYMEMLILVFANISTIGLIMIFSGICLFLEEFGIMMRTRAAVLDLIDAEEDMKIIAEQKELIESNRKSKNKVLSTQNGFYEIIYDDLVPDNKEGKQGKKKLTYSELKESLIGK